MNELPFGKAILTVWVSSTPCEHSRQLKETRPTPNFCPKNSVCLSLTAREGRQADSLVSCVVGRANPDPSLHLEPGHSTWCQLWLQTDPSSPLPGNGQHTDQTGAIPASQNYKIIRVGMDLCRSSSPTLRQGRVTQSR